MTKRQTSRRPGKQFDQNDIVRLLRAVVEREGGQTAFAKRRPITEVTGEFSARSCDPHMAQKFCDQGSKRTFATQSGVQRTSVEHSGNVRS